jgi:hypothetical protein
MRARDTVVYTACRSRQFVSMALDIERRRRTSRQVSFGSVSDRPKFLRRYRRVNDCESLRLRAYAIAGIPRFPAWCASWNVTSIPRPAGLLSYAVPEVADERLVSLHLVVNSHVWPIRAWTAVVASWRSCACCGKGRPGGGTGVPNRPQRHRATQST